MVILRTEELSKVFYTGFIRRRVEAVTRLNLEIHENEIFGFLGPNGAGKTTTIKMLLGLIHPTEGRAWLFDENIGHREVKNKVGFLSETPYFYDYLKGAEFLDFYAQLFNLPEEVRRKRIDELLELVGLSEARSMPLRKFSKGMIQRIGMAQALLNDPELVILDEPMSGLDPLGRKEIRDLILRLKQEGKTIFFSTHILPDVEMICDRVGIIHRGRLLDVGRLDEIMKTATRVVEITFRFPSVPLAEEAERDLEKESFQAPDGTVGLVRREDRIMVSVASEEDAERIQARLTAQGAQLVYKIPQRESLEEHFFRMIGKSGTSGDE
jgi:ABC-2 type transport system ATP-binding protein